MILRFNQMFESKNNILEIDFKQARDILTELTDEINHKMTTHDGIYVRDKSGVYVLSAVFKPTYKYPVFSSGYNKNKSFIIYQKEDIGPYKDILKNIESRLDNLSSFNGDISVDDTSIRIDLISEDIIPGGDDEAQDFIKIIKRFTSGEMKGFPKSKRIINLSYKEDMDSDELFELLEPYLHDFDSMIDFDSERQQCICYKIPNLVKNYH